MSKIEENARSQSVNGKDCVAWDGQSCRWESLIGRSRDQGLSHTQEKISPCGNYHKRDIAFMSQPLIANKRHEIHMWERQGKG